MADESNPYSPPSIDPDGSPKKLGRLGFFEKIGLICGPCITLAWAIHLLLRTRQTGEFESRPGSVIMATGFVFVVYGMVAAVSFAAIGRVLDYLVRRFTN